MDALLSAVAGDLIGRLVTFLIGKYQQDPSATATNTAVRLQRALLRARVVVEEAEGRQIVNRAMLQQLIQLRQQLCRAAYMLDAFRWRSRHHTRPSPSSDHDVLFIMVDNLEATLRDMREFVVLLGSCPRITRQPYSTYLFMENCMFGRQLEKEEIISFLFKPSQDLDVLPIIGPSDVGKRTLVEHVCLDERVRERFAKIHRLSSDELDLYSHRNLLFDFTTRWLLVIRIVDGDTDAEEACRRFHSAARRRAHGESKIIVMSRTEAHSSLGTVQPLRLRAPSREELWYYFRTLAFGAADPDQRPDLARIALALCTRIRDSFNMFCMFNPASLVAASLRADLSAQSWRRLLKVGSELTHLRQLGADGDGWKEFKAGPYYMCRPMKDAPDASCFLYNERKLIGVARSELPQVTMMEMFTGGALPPAEKTQFDVLVWQSRIPPYVAYVMTCDMEKARQMVASQKQTRKRRRTNTMTTG